MVFLTLDMSKSFGVVRCTFPKKGLNNSSLSETDETLGIGCVCCMHMDAFTLNMSTPFWRTFTKLAHNSKTDHRGEKRMKSLASRVYVPCIMAFLISDETFYTQSQIMVEKVPEFSAESLCLRQGWVTSGRWCHMTLLDHVTPVGGWQRPLVTATSYHPLTKAERFCRKFGNFFNHYLTLCVECFIRNYVPRVQKHSLPKRHFWHWRLIGHLGSFGALFLKGVVTQKRLIVEQNGWKFRPCGYMNMSSHFGVIRCTFHKIGS